MVAFLVRYVKFLGTSVVGTAVETLVLWLLSDLVFNEGYWGEYVISPAIAFECAVAVNFTISYFYVWKDRTYKVPGSGAWKFFRLYLAYNLSNTAIFALRLVVLLLIERLTGWDVVVCNLVSMVFSGLLNFAVTNLLIFRKPR